MKLKTICGLCGKPFGEHVGIDARCIEGIPGITFKRKGLEDWQGAICKTCYRPIQVMESGAAHFDMRVRAHNAEPLQMQPTI